MGESQISVRAALNSARFPVRTGTGVLPAGVAVGVSPAGAQAKSLAELRRWMFSFPAMLGALLVGAAYIVGRMFAVDPDLWWHVKNGQNILATHRWPTTDPYSFTVASTPWLSYEWLGDVLLGAVARFGGLQGLDALLILLSSAVMLALYAYATLRSENSKAGFVAAASLFALATPSFSLRPQMLGFLFIILTLIALERFRQDQPWVIWFLPPLFLVWINTHGSWLIGLGVIFVCLISGLAEFRVGSIEARRWNPSERLRLEFAFLLCLAAIPLTPYGTRLAAYPFTVASSLPVNVANVLEWQPMPFHLLGGKLFLGLLLGYFLAHMALRATCRLDELALFIGGTVMACLHLRFLLLFVPFFAPLLATMLARWMPRYERTKDKYVLNAVLISGAAAAMLWFFPSSAEMQQAVARRFPVRAVGYIQEHMVPGPMYNTYGYGGYLIWALPKQKVFIDGRGDLYEVAGAFSDYLQVANLKPAAFAVLGAYGIQACLLERGEPLATVLSAHPDWRQEYSDDVSVLFVRRNPAVSFGAKSSETLLQRKE